MSRIRADVLELLACPVSECRAPLTERDDCLECTACRRRYRIESSWPVLIPEEAASPQSGTEA